MPKSRLEAFSDGVLAIIITIMVLELKAPQGGALADLKSIVPGLVSYVLSFLYIGIYWNNHHHLLHALGAGAKGSGRTTTVTGAMLWANLHLLFWLSLIPFATKWMGEHNFAAGPTAVYGAPLLMAGLAYLILQRTIIAHEGPNSVVARAVGKDLKGKISFVLYLIAIPAAFAHPAIAGAIYFAVALMWLVPDKRIERAIGSEERGEG